MLGKKLNIEDELMSKGLVEDKFNTPEPKNGKIGKIAFLLLILADVVSSLTTLYSYIAGRLAEGREACGYLWLFIITLPVTAVLNVLLLIVLIIRAVIKKKKQKQLYQTKLA